MRAVKAQCRRLRVKDSRSHKEGSARRGGPEQRVQAEHHAFPLQLAHNEHEDATKGADDGDAVADEARWHQPAQHVDGALHQ